MPEAAEARTLGELRASGYRVLPIREELRRNLVAKLEASEDLFPGIYGFEDSVIPQMENAILSGQDMILLGERGQAKSRLVRELVSLLDPLVPTLTGCEINDNPFAPICARCRELVDREGDEAPIAWLAPDHRYGEKLSTPDITIADLIGEVDPIKVAEGRYLSDELTIHYGLIPRTNRGIFCINELPDLAERIQVGLLNIMEERDVQIRGYRVRLSLDVYIVATANPEDYTNRGRIITPLKDRYGAQIRTHYPKSIDLEIEIMDAESTVYRDGDYSVAIPGYMKEIVAEFTSLARRSADINQRSGVSVRVSIANVETLMSNAIRRGIRLKERQVAPRVSDLPYMFASTSGKIELETLEDGREDRIVEKLIQNAVLNVFNRHFKVVDFKELLDDFSAGLTVETSDSISLAEYHRHQRETHGLAEAIRKLGAEENRATVASALEFILEGLHLNKKLNKQKLQGKNQYRGYHDSVV